MLSSINFFIHRFFGCSFVDSLLCSFIHTFILWFTHSFLHLLLFIHSFYSPVNSYHESITDSPFRSLASSNRYFLHFYYSFYFFSYFEVIRLISCLPHFLCISYLLSYILSFSLSSSHSFVLYSIPLSITSAAESLFPNYSYDLTVLKSLSFLCIKGCSFMSFLIYDSGCTAGLV